MTVSLSVQIIHHIISYIIVQYKSNYRIAVVLHLCGSTETSACRLHQK